MQGGDRYIDPPDLRRTDRIFIVGANGRDAETGVRIYSHPLQQGTTTISALFAVMRSRRMISRQPDIPSGATAENLSGTLRTLTGSRRESPFHNRIRVRSGLCFGGVRARLNPQFARWHEENLERPGSREHQYRESTRNRCQFLGKTARPHPGIGHRQSPKCHLWGGGSP